jgi:polysaccharide export outer membrane protein
MKRPARRIEAGTLALLLAAGVACTTVPEPKPQPPPAPAAKGSATLSAVEEINRGIASMANQTGGPGADYRIGPEDLLQITLFNVPEGDGKLTLTPRNISARVSHQGFITLPLIGAVQVKGLTASALEQVLAARYDRYIHNPQVGVFVAEYRQRVSVIGAVNKPGAYELTGPRTIIDMLALAGGVTERAGSQVHVYRETKEGRQSHVIDLLVLANSASLINADNAAMVNLLVQPGDVINVPQAGMFFVDGAVKNPGSFPLGRSYFLTQALATAGGVDEELASLREIAIFRRKGRGQVETIQVDLAAIRAGTAPDPQIEADDVIVVPTSTAKWLLRRFVGSLIGGISIGSFIPAVGS